MCIRDRHKLERLENRKKYLEKGERTKRTHRLCNLGGEGRVGYLQINCNRVTDENVRKALLFAMDRKAMDDAAFESDEYYSIPYTFLPTNSPVSYTHLATTVISMIFCIPAAYSLARFQYPGRKVFMLSFLLTNAFPKLGIYTSIAVLFYKYGLMGTYAGVIIIHMINSMMFMVWLPSSAFRNVHRQQEEAARDAGASPVRTFFKVTLPMAMPGIAVATLYTFLGSMEEAQGTMLVGLARIQTMPVAMYGIVLDSSAIQIGAVFAILLIIPSALLIFVMRKYIGPEAIAGGFKMK